MKNPNFSTSLFLALVMLALLAVSLGNMCYQTTPEGVEVITSCNGSCVVKITQDREMYKCSDVTHPEGCFQYSQGKICYCNYNLCLGMIDASSFIQFYQVLNNPDMDPPKQNQHEPEQQQLDNPLQQRPLFYSILVNGGLYKQKQQKMPDNYHYFN